MLHNFFSCAYIFCGAIGRRRPRFFRREIVCRISDWLLLAQAGRNDRRFGFRCDLLSVDLRLFTLLSFLPPFVLLFQAKDVEIVPMAHFWHLITVTVFVRTNGRSAPQTITDLGRLGSSPLREKLAFVFTAHITCLYHGIILIYQTINWARCNGKSCTDCFYLSPEQHCYL